MTYFSFVMGHYGLIVADLLQQGFSDRGVDGELLTLGKVAANQRQIDRADGVGVLQGDFSHEWAPRSVRGS
jgi:hypothetical protein